MARRKQSLRVRANKAIARKVKKTKAKVKKVKSQIGRRVKRTQRQLTTKARRLKRTTLKLKKRSLKRVKKLKRIGIRKAERLKKTSIRKAKRIRKRAAKAVRQFKAARRRAYNRRFTRRDINASDPSLIGFTNDPAQSGEKTAFVKQFPESKGASKPGEPPKRRTGKGQESIKAQLITNKKNIHDIKARVYVDKKEAPYMALWEYRPDGKTRPFLKPALEDNKRIFGAAIGKALKSKLRGKL